MNSKKHALILSCIVCSLLLLGIVTISEVFFHGAVSATVVQDTQNDKSVTVTSSTSNDSNSSLEAVPTKSLYYIYVTSKWLRIKWHGSPDYLSSQYVVQNTAGSIMNRYSVSSFGNTKVDTPLKTGPGASYSDVVQLPSGMKIELLGEISNPAGEKWLMYKYAYAIFYVASKDIDVIPPPVIVATTPKAPTKAPTKPATPTPPSVPATANAQKIVSLAYSKIGSAYVYGAAGPNSFDCSGFVYWVVNNSGVPGLSVPRTSSALYDKYKSYNIGTNITNARPGDIILFSRDGRIVHSAIYYTDSKMIHASEPSTGVILTTVAYSTSNKSVFAIIRLPGC